MQPAATRTKDSHIILYLATLLRITRCQRKDKEQCAASCSQKAFLPTFVIVRVLPLQGIIKVDDSSGAFVGTVTGHGTSIEVEGKGDVKNSMQAVSCTITIGISLDFVCTSCQDGEGN